jgi:hypothetical protein
MRRAVCGTSATRTSRVTDGQPERKRLAKQLGSVDDIPKKEAWLEAKVFLAKINQPTLTPETAVTFTAFVGSVPSSLGTTDAAVDVSRLQSAMAGDQAIL